MAASNREISPEPELAMEDSSWDESSCSSDSNSDANRTIDEITAEVVAKADKDCPPIFLRGNGLNLDWGYFLLKEANLAYVAPVHLFKHAPLAANGEIFKTGIIIEAPNPFVKCSKTVNWIAKIVRFAGYKALIKYEDFGIAENSPAVKKRIAWLDFFSAVPKPFGFSIAKDVLLFPPFDLRKQCPGFIQEIKKKFSPDTPTIPADHLQTVQNAVLATRKRKLNDVVEIVDKFNMGCLWLAKVRGLVGDRIYCQFYGKLEDESGIWLNCQSDMLYDVGFSQYIGYRLGGVPTSLADLFDPCQLDGLPNPIRIQEGMVMEARHPLVPYRISFCKVAKVHKLGYFTAKFEALNDTEVCAGFNYLFHVTSPYILPCGFAQANGIDLLGPDGENEPKSFNWAKYCKRKWLKMLPLEEIYPRPPSQFERGMKLEAIDICRPPYLGPATVVKIAGHLLLIHFDGWRRDDDICYQWMDTNSPDMYPLGWGNLVEHEMQSHTENHRAEDEPGRVNLVIPNVFT